MRRACSIFLPLLLLLFVTPVRAKTHHVPGGFPTIQAAVDAAEAGDRIHIHKGPYTEDVVVQGKTDLLILGKDRPKIVGAGTAFTLIDCERVKLKNIDIDDSTSHAVIFRNVVEGVIKRVRIRGGAADGIRIEGGRTFRIRESIIEDLAGNGVWLGENAGVFSRRVDVRENKIRRNAGYGVYIAGESYHEVRKNKINKCGWAVGLGPDTLQCRVDKNTIEEGRLGGVTVDGMQNFCRWNKIKDLDGDGITVDGTDNWVRGNELRRLSGFGLHVAGTEHQIEGNKSKKVEGDGRIIEGTGHYVYREKGEKAGGRGFLVSTTGAEFHKCEVKASGSDGFFIALGATGNYIRNNTTSNSTGEGLVDENPEGANEYKNNSFR